MTESIEKINKVKQSDARRAKSSGMQDSLGTNNHKEFTVPQTEQNRQRLTINKLRQANYIQRAACGTKVSALAKEEGLSRQHVSEILNRPENQEVFYQIYQSSQTELQNRLPGLVTAALDFLEAELQGWSSYNKADRMKAAIRLLELAIKYQPCQCNCKGNTI